MMNGRPQSLAALDPEVGRIRNRLLGNWPLRSKIFLALLCIALLPFLVFTYSLIRETGEILQERAGMRLGVGASFLVSQVERLSAPAQADAEGLQMLVAGLNGRCGEGTFGVVLDSRQVCLADGAAPNARGRIISFPEMEAGDTFIPHVYLQSHGECAAVILPVASSGLRVIMAQPRQAFLGPTNGQEQFALKGSLLLAFLMFVGTALLTRIVIVGPIEHLTEVADQVSRGDLTVRATIDGTDELSNLAIAFNGMTVKLQRTLFELESRDRRRGGELAAAADEYESLVGAITTDLRMPLQSIEGTVRALRDDFSAALPVSSRNALDRILERTLYLLGLLDELLRLSRIGRQAPVRVPVDLARLVREVWTDLIPERGDRPVSLTIGNFPGLEADPGTIRQVLSILLSNSLKFSRPHTKAEIEVAWDPEQRAVFVRDDGIGFDPSLTDRLFNLFQRLHPDGAFEGAGVGLALARRILRRHGGRIWARSTPDQGASFFFTLDETPLGARDVVNSPKPESR